MTLGIKPEPFYRVLISELDTASCPRKTEHSQQLRGAFQFVVEMKD